METGMSDLVVIGGGAGGIPAAIRAAQLGGRVSIIENRDLGGQCMNRGCIPFGQMMVACGILCSLDLGKDMGIRCSEVSRDYGSLVDRKDKLIDFMRQGLESTLKKKKIEVIRGKGKILGKGNVEVNGKSIFCKSILLATGANWLKPVFPGADLEDVVNTDYLLGERALPPRVLLYGRSPWLIEIAQFLCRYGVRALLATPEKRILSTENKTIATRLAKALKNEGMEIKARCEIRSAIKKTDGLHVELGSNGNSENIVVDKIVAIERNADLKDLGLKSVGLDEDKEYVTVNERMETGAEGLYAIGDLAGPSRNHYSHLASQQGLVAAENAMGKKAAMNPRSLTRVLFTRPEVACVGLTEGEAKAAGFDVLIGAAPLGMNSFGIMTSETEGLVEVVAEKRYGEILGVHFIGRGASEMAGQGVLAVQMEATLEDLANAPFPHPTLSESLAEAARNALGRHIYLP